MMVSISGERGVGKTLHLADRVFQRRRQGYFVVTNFSHSHSNLDCSGLSPEEFLDVILNIIDFKDNGFEMFNLHPSFKHTGVYVAMDEATIYFSPEMQSKLSKSNPEKYQRLLNLLAQARKYDVEIDYVVQDPAKVGKDFRRYTEHYKRFRWVFKLKRMAYIPHPRLPIYRREHRHLLDLVWEEVHDLDAENPRFNYSTVTDEHGVQQWAPTATLQERHLRLTGKYKKHILRMYNSYQPVAVRQEEYQKEFSPLKNFRLVPDTFKRERFPTVKRFLRLLRIPVRITDEYLPPKIGFENLVLPPKDDRNKIISEVQNQEQFVLSVEDLQRDIARAYAKPPDKKQLAVQRQILRSARPDQKKIDRVPTSDNFIDAGLMTPPTKSPSARGGNFGGSPAGKPPKISLVSRLFGRRAPRDLPKPTPTPPPPPPSEPSEVEEHKFTYKKMNDPKLAARAELEKKNARVVPLEKKKRRPKMTALQIKLAAEREANRKKRAQRRFSHTKK